MRMSYCSSDVCSSDRQCCPSLLCQAHPTAVATRHIPLRRLSAGRHQLFYLETTPMTLTPSSRKPIPIKHRRRQSRTPNVASNPFSCSPLRGKGTRVFQYNLPDVLFGELAGGGEIGRASCRARVCQYV